MNSKNILPKRISRKKIYTSKLLDLNIDKVQLSTGKVIDEYHVLDYKFDSVVIFMFNKKGQICFVNSPRYVTQSLELELPSGGIRDDETILEAAQREILEETGYILKDMEHIYSFHPSNAITSQKANIVFGHCDDEKAIADFDHDEVFEVLWLNDEQVLSIIKNNKIMDSHALIALLYYYTILKNKQ